MHPPAFVRAADIALARASALVRALPAATPQNAADERRRLLAALRRGEACTPRWTYAGRGPSSEVAPLLHEAERALRGDETPLAVIYRERIAEVAREAAIEGAVGTRELARVANERYASLGPMTRASADALASEFRVGETLPDEGPLVESDADNEASLFCRMREEVGKLRLPFRVVRHDALASLAATGSDAIFVTRGRPLAREAVERTVLHEIHGHALPRARAAKLELGIFGTGTARGTDEQEGYALLLEERAGLLRGARRRELAARHEATRAMRDGATFVEVVRALQGGAGLDTEAALRVAERAFRGSDGTFPGLGRERVYLEALVHVRTWLAEHPDDEAVLASGQVATAAIAALRPFVPREPPASTSDFTPTGL